MTYRQRHRHQRQTAEAFLIHGSQICDKCWVRYVRREVAGMLRQGHMRWPHLACSVRFCPLPRPTPHANSVTPMRSTLSSLLSFNVMNMVSQVLVVCGVPPAQVRRRPMLRKKGVMMRVYDQPISSARWYTTPTTWYCFAPNACAQRFVGERRALLRSWRILSLDCCINTFHRPATEAWHARCVQPHTIRCCTPTPSFIGLGFVCLDVRR